MIWSTRAASTLPSSTSSPHALLITWDRELAEESSTTLDALRPSRSSIMAGTEMTCRMLAWSLIRVTCAAGRAVSRRRWASYAPRCSAQAGTGKWGRDHSVSSLKAVSSRAWFQRVVSCQQLSGGGGRTVVSGAHSEKGAQPAHLAAPAARQRCAAASSRFWLDAAQARRSFWQQKSQLVAFLVFVRLHHSRALLVRFV